MNTSILHYYRQARQHQLATYGHDMLFVDGVDQRQFTGGGAVYGFHAYAAYLSAKRAIHFRKTLKADIAAHKKRSKAAKKAWKTRSEARDVLAHARQRAADERAEASRRVVP